MTSYSLILQFTVSNSCYRLRGRPMLSMKSAPTTRSRSRTSCCTHNVSQRHFKCSLAHSAAKWTSGTCKKVVCLLRHFGRLHLRGTSYLPLRHRKRQFCGLFSFLALDLEVWLNYVVYVFLHAPRPPHHPSSSCAICAILLPTSCFHRAMPGAGFHCDLAL